MFKSFVRISVCVGVFNVAVMAFLSVRVAPPAHAYGQERSDDDRCEVVEGYGVYGYSNGKETGYDWCKTAEEAQATKARMEKWETTKGKVYDRVEIKPESRRVYRPRPPQQGTPPYDVEPGKSGLTPRPSTKKAITVYVFKKVDGDFLEQADLRYETDNDYRAASAYYMKMKATADKVTWSAPGWPIPLGEMPKKKWVDVKPYNPPPVIRSEVTTRDNAAEMSRDYTVMTLVEAGPGVIFHADGRRETFSTQQVWNRLAGPLTRDEAIKTAKGLAGRLENGATFRARVVDSTGNVVAEYP